ncbi:MAG: hypothetical protein A2431_00320 [Candidatus Zambryskibacteria bacterium RIFOXYC1_FULL_39_10]|uniref:Uncharacterized protein n=1 Tax=Candidatus Zambryskibacteria bacterium RIFOXYC1_FULL_39_10 TaxID=1802779 RepID=A0A1G2UZH1_9BACT|nr:MAG: hypothetical protein A2431_00320 [Candidatus Zambryskibacteria bacterium RIFOXYC1_FULL_39_10]OHB15991.1 MAG: hypothetical protein A2605_03860 [Candidatus Zambryskibacteria bacterium RIFOXYD1_FULL_39_35]
MKKKYILTTIALIVFVAPQVVFASWWNPLTWKVFKFLQKSEVKTEQVMNAQEALNTENNDQPSELEELKKEIEELKKAQTSNTTKNTPAKQPVQSATVKDVDPTPITVSIPQYNAQLCIAINEEEKLLNKNLSVSIGYFQRDLIPVFDAQVKTTDYTQRYDNLTKVKTSFFKALSDFKNKDIARISSSYLDPVYIKELKDTLTALADGYEDVWDQFQIDSLKLKSIDFYDSYDKNIGYALIEKDYDLLKEKNKLLLKSIELWELTFDKYKEVKVKNSCS